MLGLVGGKEHKFLVDTGAHVSVVSLDLVRRRRLEAPRYRLLGVGNNDVESLGTTQFSFTCGTKKFSELMEVLPTVGQGYSAILGLDFLVRHHAKIDLSQYTVELSGDLFPLSAASANVTMAQGTPIAKVEPSKLRASTLKIGSHDKVPAGTGKLIWVSVGSDVPQRVLCVVEPLKDNEALDEMHCFVRRSVARVSNVNGEFMVPVSIDNFGNDEVCLSKGLTVASLEVLHEEDLEESEEDFGAKQTVNKSVLRKKISHLQGKEQEMMEAVLLEYADLFNAEGPLPATHLTQHRIPTGNSDPVSRKPYRIPKKQQPLVEEFINQQLADGIIEPSDSPWSANIVIVPKKSTDGTKKYRFCCDYRYLNDRTTTDSYPIPNITETLDNLGKCKYFSTMDLRSGYHQLEVCPEDRPKTAFSVPGGHWQFKRMPFGLKNAPATFQRLLDGVLRGLKPKKCCVYLDDIIVYSKDMEQHVSRLREVFDRLREARLSLSIDKCHFARTEVKYLGHIISAEGVRTDPRLTSAVRDFVTPRTVKHLQSFLGLCNYYRKFVKGFAEIARPLTSLLRKGVKFEWTSQCQEAFDRLKQVLTSDPVLIFPDFEKEFILSCDASNTGLGVVLEQEVDGKKHPVAFASRQLNRAEQNYSTTEKELLSVIYGVTYFRCYLYGQKFKIITDHAALKWLLGLKDPSSRLTRWSIKLSEFDYEIIHKPGVKHGNADALSRIVAVVQVLGKSLAEWKRAQAKDKDCQLFRSQPNFEVHDGLLCRVTKCGPRIVVPQSLRTEVLKQAHDHILSGHGGKRSTDRRVAERFWWRTRRMDVDQFVQNCVPCAQRSELSHQKVQLQRLPEAERPFQMIGIDILGPFNKTPAGNKYVLTIIDHFSRYLEMIAIPDQRASTVALAMVNNWLLKFGVPESLITDQGTNFMSDLFKQLCKLLKIKKLRTSPFHPQANGRTERVHRTISKMLSYYVNSQHGDWDSYLSFVVSAYNSKVHSSTNMSPYETVYGRKMPSPFDVIQPKLGKEGEPVKQFAKRLKEVWQRVRRANTKALENQERIGRCPSKLPKYRIGQWVLLANPYTPKGKTKKFLSKFNGPYQVIEVTSPVNIKLQLPTRSSIVHISRVKPFKGVIDALPQIPVEAPKQRKSKKQSSEHVVPYSLRTRRT